MRLGVVAMAFLTLAAVSPAHAGSRFFFSGDGEIAIDHAYFQQRVDLRYRSADGNYDPVALERIEHLFRSREDGAIGSISLRLIELLDFLQDRFHPQRLVLVSGYRSPEFNQNLRQRGRLVAENSLHTQGLAADVQFAGLDLRKLWGDVRDLHTGGVGLYEKEGFLHIDVGPPRFWEPETSRVGENLSRGNARLFARTDFDRYDDLKGAVVQLYNVTALPLRVRSEAHLGTQSLPLVPVGIVATLVDGCYVIDEPAKAYALRVAASLPAPSKRESIALETCTPRIDATPAQVLTNPIAATNAE
jgi:uncharacterized protein YcbK (DUF882 family)